LLDALKALANTALSALRLEKLKLQSKCLNFFLFQGRPVYQINGINLLYLKQMLYIIQFPWLKFSKIDVIYYILIINDVEEGYFARFSCSRFYSGGVVRVKWNVGFRFHNLFGLNLKEHLRCEFFFWAAQPLADWRTSDKKIKNKLRALCGCIFLDDDAFLFKNTN